MKEDDIQQILERETNHQNHDSKCINEAEAKFLLKNYPQLVASYLLNQTSREELKKVIASDRENRNRSWGHTNHAGYGEEEIIPDND